MFLLWLAIFNDDTISIRQMSMESVIGRLPVVSVIVYLGVRFVGYEDTQINRVNQEYKFPKKKKKVKDRIRTMGIGSNFPEELWPRVQLCIFTTIRPNTLTTESRPMTDSVPIWRIKMIIVEDRKPRREHLKVYGCKAFAMTTEAKKLVTTPYSQPVHLTQFNINIITHR
jgi:hypothetical protein